MRKINKNSKRQLKLHIKELRRRWKYLLATPALYRVIKKKTALVVPDIIDERK